MTNNVVIVGAGVIGMTNAIALLEDGFNVTVFTKDAALNTNSDAAVATWYIPDNSKPLLQKLCQDSLEKLDELSKIDGAGVQRIPIIYYFKHERDFKEGPWSKVSLKTQLGINENPKTHVNIDDFPFTISASIPLIDVSIYRPFMLNKFHSLGGKLIEKEIHSLNELNDSYNIVINSAGWESKFLTEDATVVPVRGQTEIAKFSEKINGLTSINIADLDTYVAFRPLSQDCVLGTTYQPGEIEKEARAMDRSAILSKITPILPEMCNIPTTSKVGIRCGRPDVRLDYQTVINCSCDKVLMIHCYGHGGSGFSASWGGAHSILEQCKLFTHELQSSCKLKV